MWLQEIAWTEAQVPGKLADRQCQAQSLSEVKQLAAEPMFCMETALKLQRWSNLAYSDLGQDAASREWDAEGASPKAPPPEGGLVETRLHSPGRLSSLEGLQGICVA